MGIRVDMFAYPVTRDDGGERRRPRIEVEEARVLAVGRTVLRLPAA